jgi:1,2-phenylacetyl-CoA epoxidase catalytic subunit
MLAEEAFHRDLGLAWFRRLGGGSAASKEHMAGACRELLPGTLAWLAPEDEPFRRLVEAGLVEDGDRLLERYAESVGPALEGVEVDLASVAPDRSGWDEARSRGGGRPDDEAVERARGDRNRALFVE